MSQSQFTRDNFVEEAFRQNDPKAFYDEVAPDYNDLVLLHCNGRHFHSAEMCRKVFDRNDKILDVGAGTGTVGKLLKVNRFDNLHAMDISEKMLAVAKQAHIYRNYYVEGVFPNKSTTSFKNHSFDGVVTVGTFGVGHLTPEVFPNLIKMVRKGGKIVIGMRENWLYPKGGGAYPEWNYNVEQIIQDYEKSGKWKLISKEIKPDEIHGQDGVYLALEVL